MQNKKSWIGLAIFLVMVVSSVLPFTASVVAAAQVPTVTGTPPTNTPSASFVRPQIAVKSYRTNPGSVQYGQDFKLFIRLKNEGQVKASNVQATFAPGDFLPLKNGGVDIVGELGADNAVDIEQSLTASTYLYGNSSVDMTVSYYDENGASYSEKFTINISVGVGSFVNVATSTPTAINRSQLVITAYQTDVVVLQPGVQFTLQMIVQNVGSVMAKGVTMIVGGGSASGAGGETPAPGGVSGGGGEFSNFAPVGSSNVQSLGDIDKGASISATQQLIANVSINPGAYPVKVTFSYFDNKNNLINDEQVITLLVYNLPNVDVSFYQPVTSLMAGQPNPLPLQLTNLGKRSVVLGTMKIQTDNGSIENSETLVGALDTGGYFTFDSLVMPDAPGTLTISVTIDYTDDFNQARTITKDLSLEVMEMPVEVIPDPSQEGSGVEGGGFEPGVVEETFIRKAWRFVLGLLGLDSAAPTDSQPAVPEEVPFPDPNGAPPVGPKG
jgi:hypothetical protein